MTTLVVINAQVGNRYFHHGEELPPNLVPREVIDQWLDQGRLKEYDAAVRQSLYHLFPRFSGVKEQEQPPQQKENH